MGISNSSELNGVPGPLHLLEMKNEIDLSEEQIGKIGTLFPTMKSQAIPLGRKLIERERELNNRFANNTIDKVSLKDLLDKVARVRSNLRYIHLSVHLRTPEILSSKQIRLYKKLRGYSSEDQCLNIPKGHDPHMWKMHNNCP